MMLLVILLMMRVLFSFLLKMNSHHPYTFTSPLQQTLKQNHCASHNCCSVKNTLKLLALKWLLNESLLETELSEVMLVWWIVSIKLIRFFKKLSLLMFIQTIHLVTSTSLQKLSLFHLQISLWFINNILFFFCFFSSERHHLLFFFCPFF